MFIILGFVTIQLEFDTFELPQPFDTVKLTVYFPASLYVCTGFTKNLLFKYPPSPKSHSHEVGNPLLLNDWNRQKGNWDRQKNEWKHKKHGKDYDRWNQMYLKWFSGYNKWFSGYKNFDNNYHKHYR